MQLFISMVHRFGITGTATFTRKSNFVFIMRVSFFSILFFLLSVQLLLAKNAIGQSANETFITLELKNVSLTDAFKKIEKMTDYLFAYQPQQVYNYGNVSIQKASRSVSATLEILLANTGLIFKQVGNNIIILQKEGTPQLVNITRLNELADTSISGIVTNSENGQPLENVSVRIKGKVTGTTTDSKGTYRLELNNLSGVLVFSSVGYEEQEVRLGGKRVYSVALKISNKKLEDVVVIGYGSKKKIDLTGTVNSLQSDEITKARATNTQEAMQGRLPGVDIKRSSGKPGSDFSIEIRGANSITG
ncbi:MAG: hypothetical protein RIS73_1065, partial [Bacteroidota bacterium]